MRYITCVLCLLSCVMGVRGVTQIKVGVMLISGQDIPYSIERTGPAVRLALEKVNSDILNASYELVAVERTYDTICSARFATGVAADLFYNEDIVALIGPSCAYALEGVARLAGFWNIPVVTGLGDGGLFKNKTDFPTMTRFAYCQCRLRKVFGSVFSTFTWTSIVVIYDVNDAHSDVLGQTLRAGLEKGGILPHMIPYYGNHNPDFDVFLQEAADHARVIVLIVPGDSLRQILLTAHDRGYTTSGEFVFMDVELFPFPGPYWGDHHWWRGDSRDDDARAAYDALLKISLHEPTSEEWRNFSCDVIRMSSDIYNFTYGLERVNYFVGAYYDGVVRYGIALNETLESGTDIKDGYTVARRMWDKTITGVTGDVIIDDNGDRDTDFAILDLNMTNGQFQVVANYWGDRPGYTAVDGISIHWPGPLPEPPPNEPRCGFTGNSPVCQSEEPVPVYVWAVLVLLCTVVVGLVVAIFVYRRVQWERDLKDTSWRVNYSDIRFNSKTNDSVRFSKTSIKWVAEGNSNTSTEHVADQCFTRVGIYKGETVAIKRVECEKVELTRKVLLEVKQVRDVQHENLTRFVGAVVEPGKNWLLTEYCNKGSLQDVLQNDNIKLDWTFRLSLLRDIARGMAFLHRSDVRYHGNLRSSNCVVDSKFSLKVTDYGLPSLRCHKDSDQSENTHAKFEKLLWVAPEHLLDGGGSPKGDVYSFGIILEEMIVRSAPYDSYRGIMDPADIVERVANHDSPPFRPKVNQAFGPKGIHLLMYRCWVEAPEDRPLFDTIAKDLRSLQGGSKTDNIVEALIHRLEEYASNLEDIVEERTQQLIAEKKKSEVLLYQILPRTVAEQLKQGKSVVPETYESVTIYFSDIVGFTAMCSESTPMDVVSFLNDLYSLFDGIIDNFDVYKVETIGDAYMVVSGVPIRNGRRHAVEICRLALALLSGVTTFVFRHRPQDKLRVRIGIHSGPCAAGVVGVKMPRYCLFGDTVNTTSRMESTGEQGRIHLSETTKSILDKVGNFDCELRGEIPMKGKGLQTTYWLKGEHGKMQKTDEQTNNDDNDPVPDDSNEELKETDSGVLDVGGEQHSGNTISDLETCSETRENIEDTHNGSRQELSPPVTIAQTRSEREDVLSPLPVVHIDGKDKVVCKPERKLTFLEPVENSVI